MTGGRFKISLTRENNLRFTFPNGDNMVMEKEEVERIRNVCENWLKGEESEV